YKQLFDSIKITRANHIKQVTKLIAENVTLKTSVSKAKVQPSVLTRIKHAVDVELIVPRLKNNRDAHLDYFRHLKESVETIRDIVEEAKAPTNKLNILPTLLLLGRSKLLPPNLLIGVKRCLKASRSQPKSNHKTNRISPAKGCSKHMTGDRSRLLNFMKKFIGIVRFGNDHFGAIMGYGDYVVGESVISWNGVVERRNRTLIEAARTMLIFSKAPMFLWAEAVATACYTQNRSLIHTRHHKTPYELVNKKKSNLTFFRVFGALCYPTNDSEDLGKLQPTADIGIFVGYAPSRKGYRIYNKRTRRIMKTIHIQFDELTEPMAPVHLSTRPAPTFLMPGQISLGLPMFDEYLEPPRAERPGSPAQAVHVSVTSAGIPLSTTIDQDAPSPHISPSSSALQSHSLPPGVVAEPYFMEDHNVAPVDNNPFVNFFDSEPHFEASSSGDISSTESPYVS
nr:retrovirus-related Pol polyprotein from transposon TNT 1-94 [Tanacetum cinerariifolium]